MVELKKNVAVFGHDIADNRGYKYSTNAKYSSIVANRRMTEAINKTIPENVRTIIDIGCGDGTYTNEIKKNKPGIEVLGIDPVETAIQIAKEKYNNIHFLCSNIYEESFFEERNFDLAIFRGVLHHLPDPESAIKISGGFTSKLLILEPNGNNFVLKLLERFSKYHIDHEEQSFSTFKLTNWCRKNGWENVSVNYIGFVPMFFPTVIAKMILFFQPFLEKVPIINKYLSAQIVIYCVK